MDRPQEAGPSRTHLLSAVEGSLEEDRDPRSDTSYRDQGQPDQQAGEEEEDDDRMDYAALQSFADKIQRVPSAPGYETLDRPRVVIPKRGEKDFEPMYQTVNLQEMMLQRSREALFSALAGVRGGNSRTISHALLTPLSPFPSVLLTRGHLLDHMGISIRHPPRLGARSGRTHNELLPEEALYLLERGSMQIWVGNEANTYTEAELGLGEWSEEEWGVRGAVEMSVAQGFALFLGKEGLTWERYQAYAYLKRLGYTVQRAKQFIPEHFLNRSPPPGGQDPRLPPFRSWWFSILPGIGSVVRKVRTGIRKLISVLRHTTLLRGSHPLRGSLLFNWSGTTYRSLFAHLRIIPSLRLLPLGARSTHCRLETLKLNPYLPFFHVWKPATPWSKAKWDKGSDLGLNRQRPDYVLAVIESRTTPLPTSSQLAEVFDGLSDEPKGPVQKLGPQYQHRPLSAETNSPVSLFARLMDWFHESTAQPANQLGAMRNGDRALIVAVNDSGNTGWIRFGRAGFAEAAVI